jgi:hypothetical protein
VPKTIPAGTVCIKVRREMRCGIVKLQNELKSRSLAKHAQANGT